MAVSSRIFGIKIENKKTDCFAPLADMLNHRRPRQTQWFYSDLHNSFIIQSLQDINASEEVIYYVIVINYRFSIVMVINATQDSYLITDLLLITIKEVMNFQLLLNLQMSISFSIKKISYLIIQDNCVCLEFLNL